MPREKRPADYPRLLDYKPTPFMLPESHYDKAKADRAVRFIENLRHTKGKWDGKPFWLLPWQEQIIRDIFGIVDEDGNRQFRTAYVEIGKKNGKSELAAAVALYLLYADNEPSAEVYGAAAEFLMSQRGWWKSHRRSLNGPRSLRLLSGLSITAMQDSIRCFPLRSAPSTD